MWYGALGIRWNSAMDIVSHGRRVYRRLYGDIITGSSGRSIVATV